MDLVPYMFYERQEPGSQLCAQHCLNNLLQQHTYTEFDLAEIARRLDEAENAALSTQNQNKKSYNYDDTGYFSISVLERAMEVWDLTLVRWRGEAMKPYQDRPEDQGAFILHLASHWIPLRRFGIPSSTGSPTKRWYNLNSFLPNGPEWISPTYLRMVLTQAEEEGYSVFCVRRATPGGAGGAEMQEGKGWGDGGYGILPESEADRVAAVLGEPVSRSGGQGGNKPVAGSSRAPLASINPDQPTVDPSSAAQSSSAPGPSSPPARRQKRQPDLIDPDASDTSPTHPVRPPRNPARHSGQSSRDVLDDQTGTFPTDDAEDEELDEDIDAIGSYRQVENYAGPMDFTQHSRSYDDEDAALQAALKASMDDLPPDWVAPKLEPKEKPIQKRPLPTPAAAAPIATVPSVQSDSAGAGGSKFKEELEEDDEVPVEELSPGESARSG